jgi:hypothetical protein
MQWQPIPKKMTMRAGQQTRPADKGQRVASQFQDRQLEKHGAQVNVARTW